MPTAPAPETPIAKLALRAPEAAKALSISQRKLWEMTNAGQIPHAKLGRATVYPVATLEKWLADQVKG
jgi:excisionase family DNA binding protein